MGKNRILYPLIAPMLGRTISFALAPNRNAFIVVDDRMPNNEHFHSATCTA